MTDRQILFSDPMVRAILDDRKTKTRRVVKHTSALGYPSDWGESPPRVEIVGGIARFCPYGQPGDRLWVRETHMIGTAVGGYKRGVDPETNPDGPTQDVIYKADAPFDHNVATAASWAWRPSIHMPRWASRLTLEITEVRVERLNEISDADAMAEGANARLLADAIAPLAAKANAQPLHWVGGGRDEGDDLCRSCCEKRVAALCSAGDEDAFVDGGFGTEQDGAAWCSDCNAFLDCSLTDYGAEYELGGLLETGITSPTDAHTALALLNYGGNPLVGEECAGHVLQPNLKGRVARLAFRHLWDSLNAKRGYGWDVNPYVWVISFRKAA